MIFEVNTGAMARGKRKVPYPSMCLLQKLRELGGKVTLSSDCHSSDKLTAFLDVGLDAVRAAGFKTIWVWENGKFVEKEI